MKWFAGPQIVDGLGQFLQCIGPWAFFLRRLSLKFVHHRFMRERTSQHHPSWPDNGCRVYGQFSKCHESVRYPYTSYSKQQASRYCFADRLCCCLSWDQRSACAHIFQWVHQKDSQNFIFRFTKWLPLTCHSCCSQLFVSSALIWLSKQPLFFLLVCSSAKLRTTTSQASKWSNDRIKHIILLLDF